MRTTFQEELDLLETTLQEEGALVLRALRGAINALEQRDEELADEVIAFDDDVDERYVRIEEGIQLLLARQTPVASDRAHRRPRGRHRRADGVPAHGRIPRVHRRLAPLAARSLTNSARHGAD